MLNGVAIIVNTQGLLALETSEPATLYYADKRDVIRTADGEYHRFIWLDTKLSDLETVIEAIKGEKNCVVVRECGKTTSAVYRTTDADGSEDGEFENLFDDLVALAERCETRIHVQNLKRQHKLWLSGAEVAAEIEHPDGYIFRIASTGECVARLWEQGYQTTLLATAEGWQHNDVFATAMSEYLESDADIRKARQASLGGLFLCVEVEPHFRMTVEKPDGGIYEVKEPLCAEYLDEAIEECKGLMGEVIGEITGEWVVKYDSDHRHSLWFGGRVAEIQHKGYTFILGAYGDVYGTLYNSHDEGIAEVRDKNNAGRFREEMRPFISDDDELLTLLKNANGEYKGVRRLKLGHNNWFEVLIDGPNGKQYDCGWVSESDYIDEALAEMREYMDAAIADIEKATGTSPVS